MELTRTRAISIARSYAVLDKLNSYYSPLKVNKEPVYYENPETGIKSWIINLAATTVEGRKELIKFFNENPDTSESEMQDILNEHQLTTSIVVEGKNDTRWVPQKGEQIKGFFQMVESKRQGIEVPRVTNPVALPSVSPLEASDDFDELLEKSHTLEEAAS